jgi:hypothetical protein
MEDGVCLAGVHKLEKRVDVLLKQRQRELKATGMVQCMGESGSWKSYLSCSGR